MRQTAIGFRSQGLTLEGVLTSPQGIAGDLPTLVVCHPHPVLGGDMENAVVMAICRAADSRGLATLRFNFRGVGDSEGEFSNGKGEQRDVESALKIAQKWPGLDGKRIAVAGYSFGASVVLGGLRRCRAAHLPGVRGAAHRRRQGVADSLRQAAKAVRHRPERPHLAAPGPAERARRHASAGPVRRDCGRGPQHAGSRDRGRRDRGVVRGGRTGPFRLGASAGLVEECPLW